MRSASAWRAKDIDALYASDLGRTRATAAPIAAAIGLAIVHDKALRERNYGAFEGRTFAEIESAHPAEYQRMRSRDPHYAPPGGESAVQFRDRIVTALGAIAERESGRRAAVVTHGGVLGILYRDAMGIALEAKRSYPIANASLNHFRFAGGRWVIEAWGDVAHLPAGGAGRGRRMPAIPRRNPHERTRESASGSEPRRHRRRR